jgi:hypothetical protein
MHNRRALAQEPVKSMGVALPHESSEMWGRGRSKRVVLISQRSPNCSGEPNVSGICIPWRRARNETATNPIINSISCGGDLAHDYFAP